MEFNNCNLDFATSSYLEAESFSSMKVFGGTHVADTTSTFITGGNSGRKHEFVGIDLSIYSQLVGAYGNNPKTDDMCDIIFRGCKVASGVTYSQETFTLRHARLLVTNCANTKAAAEYQYYFHTFGGTVEDETGKYRNNSTPFPLSGQKACLKVVTNSNTNSAIPFVCDLPMRYTTAGGTLRLHFMSSTALTAADIWIDADFPDDVDAWNTYQYNVPDPFTTPSLSTSTEVWTGYASENRYYIDIDTTGGSAGYPVLRLNVAKASTTIYIDSELELV